MTKKNLLEGDIKKHMVRLAIPNVGGMLAIILYNVTDTYFVSKLGDIPLAAMGFTFPVVMVIGAIATGISMGASSILARAVGSKDHHLMKRIATDGILLSLLAIAIISSVGLLTITPLFRALNAKEEVLPYIREYMVVWYSGVVVALLPPVSDSCMRAIGDMKRPLYVMLICAVVNVVLDPILMFDEIKIFSLNIKGLNMGIRGAAIATLIARSCGMIMSLSFVHFKYKLLNFKYKSLDELFNSWKSILKIGIPGAIIRLLPQVVRGVLTKVAAIVGGTSAVAAIAAGTRIEGFSQVLSMAVGVSLIPIMGQNYGAEKFERVETARKMVLRIAILFGLILSTIAILFGKSLGDIFSDNSEIINYIGLYLIIITVGSIGLNLYNWLSEGLTAIGRPKVALKLNIIGTVTILIPLIIIGSKLLNFTGMLIGLSLGQIVLGIAAEVIAKKEISRT